MQGPRPCLPSSAALRRGSLGAQRGPLSSRDPALSHLCPACSFLPKPGKGCPPPDCRAGGGSPAQPVPLLPPCTRRPSLTDPPLPVELRWGVSCTLSVLRAGSMESYFLSPGPAWTENLPALWVGMEVPSGNTDILNVTLGIPGPWWSWPGHPRAIFNFLLVTVH